MVSEQTRETGEKKIFNSEQLEVFLENIKYLHEKSFDDRKSNVPIRSKGDDKLRPLFLLKQEYDQLQNEAEEYNELLKEASSPADHKMLCEEIDRIKSEKETIEEKVVNTIIQENNIKHNCLIEIRPGAGGVEAGLFARDLFQMYHRFTEDKKWKIEVLDNRADSLGNLSFISFLVKGKNAFSYLQGEAGVHRVQRVPLTESKGRIQTSTASVVVLPEVSEVAVKIENKDIRIDTYRSSGAGGQHVNTTNSAIRITHIPTGISTVSQDGRSQHDNKEKAFLILRSRLFEKYKNEQEGELGSIRSSAIGSGERAEKIRTYNYPQNRVTDHRIGFTINKLDVIIEGGLEEICKELMIFQTRRQVMDFIEKVTIESKR